MKLILLVGPPASGKSTLAHEYESQGFVRVNQDDQGKSHLEIFNRALAEHRNIVVDRMGFSIEQRARYLKPAEERGYETEIIILKANYETCLKRCLARTDHPTIRNEANARDALKRFFSFYQVVERHEALIVREIAPEVTKTKAIICDIDGCLADPTHRRHFVRDNVKKNWPAFFDAMSEDPVNLWCKTIVNSVRDNLLVIITSGRPDTYRAVTEAWLDKHHIFRDALHMRGHSSRPDTEVKRNIWEWEIKDYYDILFVIDDRQSVVKMWRKQGLVVLDPIGEAGDF